MADTDEPVFENDQQIEEYFADPERSECLSSSLCWMDAVEAVKKGCADFIARNIDNGDKWSAYRLRHSYEKYREMAHTSTKRYHRLTFDRSRG